MATSFPIGWHVASGVLGTDIDTSTTSLSGGLSIHFPATASSDAELVGDWIQLPDRSVAGDDESSTQIYYVTATLRASANGATKKATIKLDQAPSDRSSVTTDTIFDAPLNATNTWQPIGLTKSSLGLSTTRWIRFKIHRSADIDFDLYLDNVEIKQAPVSHIASRSTSTAFTGSWATVTWTTINQQNMVTRSTDTLTVNWPGLYQISGSIQISDAVADGDTFGIRIAATYDSSVGPTYIYGSSLSMGAAYSGTPQLSLTASGLWYFNGYSGTTPLTPGTVKLEVVQMNGTPVNYLVARLSVVRITDR